MGMKPRQPIALTLDECEPITDADLYDEPTPEPEGPTELYERGFEDGQRKATIASLLENPACSPLEFSVLRFAEVMLRKLRDNEHKGGWEGDSLGQLSARVTDEWFEAQQAMSTFTASVGLEDDLATLSLECSAAVAELADVGNFCMMLAERVQALYKKAASEQ